MHELPGERNLDGLNFMLGEIPSNEIPAWGNPCRTFPTGWYFSSLLTFLHAGIKYLRNGCYNLLGNHYLIFMPAYELYQQ